MSATPVMASSIGSVDDDPSIGEDIVQGAYTQYEEVGTGSTSTDVYLTVDNSDVKVVVPTTIILDGTPTEDGEYIGKYSVRVEGDMSGNQTLMVQPKEDTVSLMQQGKNNETADIQQEQTIFSAEDLKNKVTTTGIATATALTAGTWKGNATFEIAINDPSTAKIEYFTWTEDSDFTAAYASSDLSDYPGLTVAEKNDNSNYSYPDATAITGLTEEGIEWIQNNNGRLILPTFATSIADSTNSGLDSAFGRWNRTYGSKTNDVITYVYSPKNIKYIGDYAFVGLENLQTVNLNSKSINDYAFMDCSMYSVNLNNQCVEIGYGAFATSEQLTNVVNSDNVLEVGNSAFRYCYSLKNIDLKNCETIGDSAFLQTWELNTIHPTNSLTKIGNWAFFQSDCNDDFSELSNCQLGDYASVQQRWPSGVPDYTYSSCENVVEGFSQVDPRWANAKIANSSKTYGTSGCGWCCVATAYNYYFNSNKTPVDIANMVYNIDPALIGDGAYIYGNNKILSELGLTNGGQMIGASGQESDINKLNDLQSLMTALKNGAIIHIHNGNNGFSGNHGLIAYGVTIDGQLMCVTSDAQIHSGADPDYNEWASAAPIYFTIRPEHLLNSYDGYEIITKIN